MQPWYLVYHMYVPKLVLFQLVPGGFSDLINQKNYNSIWKKLLGFRNIQEKLEKECFSVRNDFNTWSSRWKMAWEFAPREIRTTLRSNIGSLEVSHKSSVSRYLQFMFSKEATHFDKISLTFTNVP
jgi:hypothetical protein